MTKEENKEHKKCESDPIYFIEKYIKLESVEGINEIKLFDCQKDLLKQFQNKNYKSFTIWNSRQLGLTSLIKLFIFWKLNFSKQTIAFITKNENILIRDLKNFIKYIPDFLNNIEYKYTKSIYSKNENHVRVYPTFESTLKDQIDLIIFENQDLINPTFVKQCVNISDTKFIFFGTPTKTEDPLNQLYEELNGDEHYKIKLDWRNRPNRDEKWKEHTMKQIGDSKIFDANFECKI